MMRQKLKKPKNFYNQQQQLINEKFQQDVTNTIKIKSNELAHKSTETILKKVKNEKEIVLKMMFELD